MLAPDLLLVNYEVSLAELTLAQDLRQLDGDSFSGERAALFERYARVVGPLNARGFLVSIDRQPVDLRPVGFAISVEDHLRIAFQFQAKIPSAGRLRLHDSNYESAEGSSRLGLRVDPGITVLGERPPPDAGSIPWQPTWQMTDADERRTKHLEVEYRPAPTATPTANQVAPRAAPATARPARTPATGLTRMLDRPTGADAIGWLGAAFMLGLIHAIQPGHGKTLVAAATMTGPHAARRGVGLGLLTAASHLASVAAVAAVLWWFQTHSVTAIHLVIARGAGCLIAAVGFFRVGRHLAGIPDWHDHPVTRARPTNPWVLGIAAGIVPCWDAVALVVLAGSLGQLGWGLTLLGAFSLGLATVLVGVGWLAGRVQRGIGASPLGRGTERWLGLASGVILAAIGLGLLQT